MKKIKKINKKPNKTVPKKKNKKIKSKFIWAKFFITKKEKELFMENFSMLLGSGINIRQILHALKREARSKAMKSLIAQIEVDIENGESLWESFQKTDFLSDYFISLVKMGEESGTLVENLTLILEQQNKERNYNSKIRSAMLYPIFVVSLTTIVGLGTAWFVLPRLTNIFTSLGIDLPRPTRVLISFSNFINSYGAILIPVFLAVAALAIFFLFFYPKTKFIGFWMLFKVPGAHKLIQNVELARLGHFLGTLLEAGIPILRSLTSLYKASTFKLYSDFYKKMHDDIKEGLSIEESFDKHKNSSKLVPYSVQQLIVAGEQSGKLRESLLSVGQTYEARIDTATKNLSVILEPVLLVVVWIGVLFVALSIILPIYSLVGGINVSNQGIRPKRPEETRPVETTPTIIIDTPTTEVISTSTEEIITATSTEFATSTENLGYLQILQTGTGYLNARSGPSLASSIITRVFPEEFYYYNQKQNGWYEIIINEDTNAWVNELYVKEIQE